MSIKPTYNNLSIIVNLSSPFSTIIKYDELLKQKAAYLNKWPWENIQRVKDFPAVLLAREEGGFFFNFRFADTALAEISL